MVRAHFVLQTRRVSDEGGGGHDRLGLFTLMGRDGRPAGMTKAFGFLPGV
jgi:hypothetical protein